MSRSWLRKDLNAKIPATEHDAYVRHILYAPDPPITTVEALTPSQVKVLLHDLRDPMWNRGVRS